jgi:alpha-galactosidase
MKLTCLLADGAKALVFLAICHCNPAYAVEIKSDTAPPNSPATIVAEGKNLIIQYNGQTLLRAEFSFTDPGVIFTQKVDEQEGRVIQALKWVSAGKPLKLTGIIDGSGQSFSCEADPPHEAGKIVRHSVGLSNSLLNRAVYDRRSDWVISVNWPTGIRIIPVTDNGETRQFRFEATGNVIEIDFRPLFYQKHRGLSYYKPWMYDVWQPSVAGWCSWFAYFNTITEQKIEHAADVVSKELAPYGIEYLQIDDGYQKEPGGLPETWLTGNEKFPSGLDHLCSYIQSKRLKPGIWTYTSFHQKEYAFRNRDLFVRNTQGDPAYGNWIGYIMDGSNPAALNTIIKPIYKGFRDMGWQYFKVDALRHLRYEGYNSYNGYFTGKKADLTGSYRNLVQAIRNEIGEDNFMLGCWGIRPELVGIINSCRIGGDGFGYGGLSQYNSFNNVVWRNDPDHIELTPEEAYRSCMVTSMTGSVFMLTDKPEVYATELVEAARRSIPVMFTQPGQLYDADPSRSSKISRVGSELNGDGPRVFDAGQDENKDYLYLLEVNKPFGNWMLLGRMEGAPQTVTFKELGLDDGNEYLVFEFWTKKLIGSFQGDFPTGEISPKYRCQLFCIRERQDHPQLLATNRHITCGGYDLEDLKWENSTLSGKSKVVKSEEYKLYIAEPAGYAFVKFESDSAKITSSTMNGMVREISFKADTDSVSWSVTYDHMR